MATKPEVGLPQPLAHAGLCSALRIAVFPTWFPSSSTGPGIALLQSARRALQVGEGFASVWGWEGSKCVGHV